MSSSEHYCSACDTTMTGLLDYKKHLDGKPHKKRLASMANDAKDLYCEDCGVFVPGEAARKQHLEGKSHKAMVERKRRLFEKAGYEAKPVPMDVAAARMRTCDICKVSFTGVVPYEQHKKEEANRLLVSTALMGNLSIASNSSGASSSNGDSGNGNQQYRCDACDVSVSGKDNYDKHMQGKLHAKKMAEKTNVESLNRSVSTTSTASSSSTTSENADIFCKICKTSVCGKENYQKHLEGAKHQRKLKSQGQLQAQEEPKANDDEDVGGEEDAEESAEMEMAYSIGRGLCLIINQENFQESAKHKTRTGTDFDAVNLKKIMEEFNFEVVVKKDLSFPQLDKTLQEALAKLNGGTYFIFTMCVLSHGKEGFFYCTDGKEFTIGDLANYFQNERCPGMKERPKVFVINACRGVSDLAGVEIDGPAFTKPVSVEPNISHRLIVYSTIENHVSYRITNKGSVFIAELCEVLKVHGDKAHLEDVITMVNSNLIKKPVGQNGSRVIMQLSERSSILSKFIWLKRRK